MQQLDQTLTFCVRYSHLASKVVNIIRQTDCFYFHIVLGDMDKILYNDMDNFKSWKDTYHAVLRFFPPKICDWKMLDCIGHIFQLGPYILCMSS